MTDDPPLEREYPPLDAVDSRWWYWVAAYPLVVLLFVPLVVLVLVFFVASFTVVVPGNGPAPPPRLFSSVVILVLMLVGVVLALATFVAVLILPVALYMDARAVARADLEWEPEPVVYGLLGVAQFFVTPLVGVIVAVYYLYRRHEAVGVP